MQGHARRHTVNGKKIKKTHFSREERARKLNFRKEDRPDDTLRQEGSQEDTL
jgi:hypothetical protein